MPGLVITIGGKLDASYKGALHSATAMAKAEGIKLQAEAERVQRLIMTRAQAQREIMKSLAVSSSLDSTVLNFKAPKNAATEYAEFWKQALISKNIEANDAMLQNAMRFESKLHSLGQGGMGGRIRNEVNSASAQLGDGRRIQNLPDASAAQIAAGKELEKDALTRLQMMDLVQAKRANELSSIRRVRAAEKIADAEQKAELLAQGVAQAKADQIASTRWLRRLRDTRRSRAAEKADQIAAAAEEIAATRAAQLADAAEAARGSGPGLRTGSHGKTGIGGVVAEVATIGHEFLQGRGGGRIIGSISILGQRLGWLRKIVKTTADSFVDAAHASEVLHQASAKETIELEAKAAATVAAGTATAAEIAETRAAAAASLDRTTKLGLETTALVEKAEIEMATAVVTSAAIGVVLGFLVGLGAGAFAAHRQVSALIEKLSGVKMPDIDPEYIAKHLKKTGQIAEVQKEINKEIEKSIANYNSAASAAERVSKATKEHYAHLRKMNELSNLPDNVKAANALKINDEERAAEVQNKNDEKNALETEATDKQAKADAVLSTVSSKSADEELIKTNKAKYDAANEAAKKIEESKKDGTFGVNARDAFRAYNAVQGTAGKVLTLGLGSSVSNGELDAAEDQVNKARDTYKKSYEDSVDRAHDNDVIRAPAEDAAKEAGAAFSKAATIGLELPEMKKNNKQASADESAESKAQLLHNKSGGTAQVTERERIGLGAASSIQVSILNEAKQHKQISVQQLAAMQQMVKEMQEGGW